MNPYLLRSALVAALGGLLFGFDTAVISGTTRGLTEEYGLTPALLGFAVSSALWGTVLGALAAGRPADKYGRRNCLRVMAALFIVSAAGCALAWNLSSLVFFRFIGGVAIGGSSVIAPMYIAEISPPGLRGRLVGLFQLDIVVGILLAYLSNYVVAQAGLGAAEWRWKFAVEAIPAAVFFYALFGTPRSPRWLVAAGHRQEARRVLADIGAADPDWEIEQIAKTVGIERVRESEPLFQRRYRTPIFLAVSIGMFNQLSGINAILYYLNDIFEQAGFSRMSGDLQAVAVGFTNLLFTILAMSVIDKVGRRKLLLTGAVGMAATLGGVAAIFATGRNQELLLWLLLAFIASFAISQGAVVWVYLSEVFPTLVRAKGQAAGASSHWIANALISALFPVVAASSRALPFVFFSAMMVVMFFVVLAVYPETKGATLEEMEQKMKVQRA